MYSNTKRHFNSHIWSTITPTALTTTTPTAGATTMTTRTTTLATTTTITTRMTRTTMTTTLTTRTFTITPTTTTPRMNSTITTTTIEAAVGTSNGKNEGTYISSFSLASLRMYWVLRWLEPLTLFNKLVK